MTELSAKTADRTDICGTVGVAERADAPPLAPFAHPTDQVIDLAHLARMTGGDHELEREVLRLFAMQCEALLVRMRGATSPVVGALAHTLNGSARGVGAWAVTEAAEAVERVAAGEGDIAGAVERLSTVATETRAAIVEMDR
jgi:HPt (histidine-containing phosphotransfer) domain-containing protein